jgi:hypothetical protein
MHRGISLTDEDRWPWLRAIAAWDRRDARIGQARRGGLFRAEAPLPRCADRSVKPLFVCHRGRG